LATATLSDSCQVITTEFQRGTPGFRAPELLGTSHFSNRVDIWAIGCILYEIVTRQKLFQTDFEVWNINHEADPEYLSKLKLTGVILLPNIAHSHVSECLRGLLQKDPRKRPSALSLNTLFESYCSLWDTSVAKVMEQTSLCPSYVEWKERISNVSAGTDFVTIVLDCYRSLNPEKDTVKRLLEIYIEKFPDHIGIAESLAEFYEIERDWNAAIRLRRYISTINPSDVKRQTEKIEKCQSALNIQMIDAALEQRWSDVSLFLAMGADVNAEVYHGGALQIAACYGDIEGVKLLLEEGANVNAQGGYFGNALQAALLSPENLDLDVISLLLEAGADVNAVDSDHSILALQAAAKKLKANVKAVSHLPEKGTNSNAKSQYRANARYSAALDGNIEAVSVLLENGANPNEERGKRLVESMELLCKLRRAKGI
jgi:Protein kinase domain/Ankyrin repeats (3 copies)